jgi:DNA replication protein DnaC
MTDELDQLLKNLKLKKIHEILDRELTKAEKNQISYSKLLARLFREEYQDKRTRNLQRRIRQAKMPELYSLETFPFQSQPPAKVPMIKQLGELDFIPRAQNIVFIGGTGVGKTGLASSLLYKAIENGYRGLFIKAQDLFDNMYASLADHSSRKLLNKLKNLDLLLIDEMGYLNLQPEQSNIFFKLMDERYNKKSTIITTNLEYDEWYEFLGQKSMVAALLDRLRHHCHTINLGDKSLRTPDITV